MKNSTHNLSVPVHEQHYKRNYIERKLEEIEAEQEIRLYDQRETRERCIDYTRDDTPKRPT